MKKYLFIIFGILCVAGIACYIISIYPEPQYIATGIVKLDEIEKNKYGEVIDIKEKGYGNNYVISLDHGKIYENGLILTKDNKIVEAVTIIAYGKDIKNHRLLKYKKTEGDPKIEYFHGRLAVIDQPGSSNYYHWLFQVLPKIKLLQVSGVKWDKIYVPGAKTKFQQETLALLGVKPEQMIFGKEDTITIADTLIVPSIPVWLIKGKSYSYWVLSYLNNAFFKDAFIKLNNDFRRIYISRSKRPARNVINEKELMDFLSKKGFKKIYLEDLPVVDQAKLFKQAEIIIGTHGAGLSGVAFADGFATLIEITGKSDEHPNPAFEKLASKKKLNYRRFQAESQAAGNVDEMHAYNVYIDIPRFKEFLFESCGVE